jgi:3-oxoadipate enol-lactonase
MLDFDRHQGGTDGALVLLHSLSLDRSVWDDFVPHVADRFDVFAVDLPGHGESPIQDDMSIEAMADAVADLIEGQGVAPALVLGLSLGGCVAQATAVRHPDLVRGLGLLDTTCWYGEQAPQNWETRAQNGRENGMAALVDFQVARWFTAEFNESHPEVGERLGKVWSASDVDAYVATCRAMGAVDLRDGIRQIDVPTTIVVGENDMATDLTHAEAMRERITGATLHVIPNCAHLSPAEHPGTVARILEGDLFARI